MSAGRSRFAVDGQCVRAGERLLPGRHAAVDVDGVVTYTMHPMPTFIGEMRPGDLLGFDAGQRAWYDAVHEAGHAVIGASVGLSVLRATIVRSGDIGGQVTVEEHDPLPWMDIAVMCAAGEQASLRWMRDVGLYTSTRGWAVEMLAASDRRTAEDHSGGHPVITESATTWHDWRRIGAAARECLTVRWPAVLDLAAALVTHRTLTAADYPFTAVADMAVSPSPTGTLDGQQWATFGSAAASASGRRAVRP